MAFFKVTLEKIDKIDQHPNADSLEVCSLKGLQFSLIVKKGVFKEDEEVVFFPLDSQIPLDLLSKMGFVKDGKGMLAGKEGNIVKTVRLRGILSEGLVIKKALIESYSNAGVWDSDDLAPSLGVTKYEPEERLSLGTNSLRPFPSYLSKYDIEGADRYNDVVEVLRRGLTVVVTEKMEGTNFAATVSLQDDGDVSFDVCQRSGVIVPQEGSKRENVYLKMAEKLCLKNALSEVLKSRGYKNLTIYGELIGPKIQGNIYGLKEYKVLFFDMVANGEFMPFFRFKSTIDSLTAKGFDLEHVPILHIGDLEDFLNERTIKEASNGASVLSPNVLREGIVIQPAYETIFSPELNGRTIIKQRSPDYLTKEKCK